MPSLGKSYAGHIALLDKPSRHIKEYGRREWADGITVSCYIPATTGKFFMGKWSVSGHRKGIPYSVEFIRDGESVNRLLFDKQAAMAFHGGHAGDYEDPDGKKWYFVFREFTCAGGDDEAPVPDDIGTLQIVIRDIADGEMDSILPSRERAASEGAEHEGYRRAQALYGNLQDNHNTFIDWHDSKPRHTHHAEMVQGNGTIWKNRVHPLDFLPKSLPGQEDNIVARFIFYYTSPEQVNALATRENQQQYESDEDICLVDAPSPAKRARRDVETSSSVTPKFSPVKAEPETLEMGLDSTNNRHPSALEGLVKSEVDIEKAATLAHYLKQMKDLQDKIRAFGEAVEGDEKKPIIVV